uniref:GTP-binding protein Rhes n=1 Tax=Cacopsylla melanoneura TaxID=428564 RepID=A0A8D8YSH2_9HEMI
MKGRHQFKRRFSLQPSSFLHREDSTAHHRTNIRNDTESSSSSSGEGGGHDSRHKIVVMGSPRVGKSSIIQRFLFNNFSTKYKPTIEEMFHEDFSMNGVHLKLDILDSSGAHHSRPNIRNKGFLIECDTHSSCGEQD